MTTIAYKDGIMACDGLVSESGNRFTVGTKIFRLPSNALLGVSGDCDFRAIVDLLADVKSVEDLPSSEELGALGQSYEVLLVLKKHEFYCVETPRDKNGNCRGQVLRVKEKYSTVGSGSLFAFGAFEMGASAEEAIKVACKYDLYSSPPFFSMEI